MFKILILIFMIGCSLHDNPRKLDIDKMNLEIELIPESYNGVYSISWNDTLCSEFNSEWNYLQIRPYELYCYITNLNEDTLGYYCGLSSPRQFTYFQTKASDDSIVNANFFIGINHFSEFISVQTQEYIDQFNKINEGRIEFTQIRLNLNDVMRKKMEIELIKIKD